MFNSAFSYHPSQMELTQTFLETWVSNNVRTTPEADKTVTTDELWAAFQEDNPSVNPFKESFLSLLGRVMITLGFKKVAFFKQGNHKIGYRGSILTHKVKYVHNWNVENVKIWAKSKLKPGSLADCVNKEDAWTSFSKFSGIPTTENHRHQFFSIFGKHLVGQGPYRKVSSNKKRKLFVGIRFKESTETDEPHQKRGKTDPAEQEELQHVERVEDAEKTDDCLNSDTNVADGNSSDHMNKTEVTTAVHIACDKTEDHSSDQEQGLVPETECENEGTYSEYEEEQEELQHVERVEDAKKTDDCLNSDTNVEDGNSSDHMNKREVTTAVHIACDKTEDHSSDQEQGLVPETECENEGTYSEYEEETDDEIDIELQDVKACDGDDLTQHNLFLRHNKKIKFFLPSNLPGKPKSFKSYLDEIFQIHGPMQGERLNIQKRCGSTTSFNSCKLRALVAASFPPIKVGKLGESRIPSTFDGDSFPQFSHAGKSNFLCEICIPFQKWAMENGQPRSRLRCRKQAPVEDILAGTATLMFSGLVQVGEHASSECHKQAIAFVKAEEDASQPPKPSPSSVAKKASTGQQSIAKFFRPLNREGPPVPLQHSKLGKVDCHHYWVPEVVKQFSEDRQIRRCTAKSMFLQQLRSGAVSCYNTMEGHEGCNEYKRWSEKHPVDARHLIEKANRSYRSEYIPKTCNINVYGRSVQIDGSIKSIDPPCLGEASPDGENPFTCSNCAKQERDLKDVLRHREKGNLSGMKDRIGVRGFNQRYAKTLELNNALKTESRRRKEAERHVKELTRVKLSEGEWEKCLMDSCLSCDEEKLILDLRRLFSMGISKTKPVQVMVLRNLTSKLLKKNNNHYLALIKDISSLFKNELGSTNYSLLADMFGLAGETTAAEHGKEARLDVGINLEVIDNAAQHYRGFPVNEASDGARSLRYLQPRLTNSGEVVILGKMWNPDVQSWNDEVLHIPRQDASKGDQDDYDALKRLVEDLLNNHQLAKSVSIHNFTGLATVEKQSQIYCMWPTPDKGYKACHLLKYWENLRRLCFYTESGDVRGIPVNLLTYSTDSAGFSLSAANKLMKPTRQEVEDGVVFLGLGVDGERYLAPYYWNLPSIACLDYDHEQRLLLKNLKYETRELTFWVDEGKFTRLATIQHLHDLKNRCQNLGLDCGFTATDLLLVFFCDQNSDACERLFTNRIADLLDEHIPGSKGTSLYIRAACRLLDPFRKIDFGSPAEIQSSVSSAITVLRLWKKVLELKKMPLHSKPGAKTDPSKRGRFLTNGCYVTAEILFAAATLYQLAMFLHFRDVGLAGSSLYNTGTKSTERIISELQGKTNEIQSLDSQPTLADMLDKSSKVQFNINAKQRLAQAGANVKQSSNRRKKAYAFQQHASKADVSYEYPSQYRDFLDQQRKAHFQGVKDGQALFQKYMPVGAVELLQQNDYWDTPYTFEHPADMKVMDGRLPENYSMLDKTYAEAKDRLCDVDDDIETAVNDDEEENECNSDDEQEEEEEQEENGDSKEDDINAKGKEWKISKVVGNRTTYIHVKQALKLILPREYIARCRQKRHWAAKYLPGKAPVDPKHDIVKFSHVALKSVQQGHKVFDIARVEGIQSVKDGSDCTSFKLKGDSTMRCRFSFYERSSIDDTYHIHPSLGLTHWRASSSIIGTVELVPASENITGCYKLHEESRKLLHEMGFICRGDYKDDGHAAATPIIEEEQLQNPLPDDFYEIEDVVTSRLRKDTLTYEFRVRFKGYSSEDDMWLPASYFNRAVNFESRSKFGRKRKHKIDPDTAQEIPEKRKRAASSGEKTKIERKSNDSKKWPLSQKQKSDAPLKKKAARSADPDTAQEIPEKRKRAASSGEKTKIKRKSNDSKKSPPSQKQKSDATLKKKAARSGNKGKTFRSSLPCGTNESIYGKQPTEGGREKDFKIEIKPPATDVNSHTFVYLGEIAEDKETPTDIGVLADVLRRDDNFRYPRRLLGESTFPDVDRKLARFTLDGSLADLTDPITVTKLPPQSVLEKIEKEMSSSRNAQVVAQIPLYGNFNKEGIRVLQRFHRVKRLRSEVSFETKWLEMAFKHNSFREEATEALLIRWNLEGKYLASYDNYRITSQELSLLVGERYVSDEVINFLGQKYCDKANEESQLGQNIFLPSYLSTGKVLNNVVEHICHQNDMEGVVTMFLPVHMNSCHWGLAIFSMKNQTVYFDDGYHCPVPQNLKKNAREIIQIIFRVTGNDAFNPSSWCDIKRFTTPLPDQPSAATGSPDGSGSCGVAVIYAIRDGCRGNTESFSWTYQEAPQLRAGLMIELLDLHKKP